jgi:drug/metabolite transporter (DMT)-like permease
MPLLGEIAALAAAFGFSITSICYTLAGRKLTALETLSVSLPISWLPLLGVHRLAFGAWFPQDASAERWLALGISGFLAFLVASYFLLRAYQDIGPQRTMVMVSFSPALGAVLAWIFLGQTLPANSIIGISVVLIGITWVVLARDTSAASEQPGNRRRGLIFAALATLAQSTTFIFASIGMADDFPAPSASLIRITVGMIAVWGIMLLQGKGRATARLFLGDRRRFLLLMGAGISGPVISGSLLLLSLQLITVGVSTTLSHTTSIMLIPISAVLFGERISLRVLLGTVVSIVGIAILFG